MREVASGVHQLSGVPSDLVNTYLVEDVLIDAGARFHAKRILRELSGHRVTAHALTHAHPDHAGSSHAVCTTLGIPFWVGERDVPAAESLAEMRRVLAQQTRAPLPAPIRDAVIRGYVATQFAQPHPVDRALREGDEVAGFQVLETPGHSVGHLAFWRERDRVLIAGDVLWNFHILGSRPGLTEPPGAVNADSAQNRDSARRLAALEPAVVLFGHGPPLRDTAAFTRLVARLD